MPLFRLSRCSLALILRVAIELLRMSAGGVAEELLPPEVGGGGGLSRPTSSSSILALAAHLSRLLPGLLLVLPASRSLLRSRPSPLESAFPMLRFWGDMQTSGPLHSREAEEEDDCEDDTTAAAAMVVDVELGGRLLCRGVPRGFTPWCGEPKDVACGDMRDRCGER